jgi:hypothetical protein
MEHPTLRLPWNHELTTNSEAKDGWTMKQLEKMCKRKHKAWLAACKRVSNLAVICHMPSTSQTAAV